MAINPTSWLSLELACRSRTRAKWIVSPRRMKSSATSRKRNLQFWNLLASLRRTNLESLQEQWRFTRLTSKRTRQNPPYTKYFLVQRCQLAWVVQAHSRTGQKSQPHSVSRRVSAAVVWGPLTIRRGLGEEFPRLTKTLVMERIGKVEARQIPTQLMIKLYCAVLDQDWEGQLEKRPLNTAMPLHWRLLCLTSKTRWDVEFIYNPRRPAPEQKALKKSRSPNWLFSTWVSFQFWREISF